MFSKLHGENIEIQENGHIASWKLKQSTGIAFSKEPISQSDEVILEMKGFGQVEIGFTTEDPSFITSFSTHDHQHLTFFKVMKISESKTKTATLRRQDNEVILEKGKKKSSEKLANGAVIWLAVNIRYGTVNVQLGKSNGQCVPVHEKQGFNIKVKNKDMSCIALHHSNHASLCLLESKINPGMAVEVAIKPKIERQKDPSHYYLTIGYTHTDADELCHKHTSYFSAVGEITKDETPCYNVLASFEYPDCEGRIIVGIQPDSRNIFVVHSNGDQQIGPCCFGHVTIVFDLYRVVLKCESFYYIKTEICPEKICKRLSKPDREIKERTRHRYLMMIQIFNHNYTKLKSVLDLCIPDNPPLEIIKHDLEVIKDTILNEIKVDVAYRDHSNETRVLDEDDEELILKEFCASTEQDFNKLCEILTKIKNIMSEMSESFETVFCKNIIDTCEEVKDILMEKKLFTSHLSIATALSRSDFKQFLAITETNNFVSICDRMYEQGLLAYNDVFGIHRLWNQRQLDEVRDAFMTLMVKQDLKSEAIKNTFSIEREEDLYRFLLQIKELILPAGNTDWLSSPLMKAVFTDDADVVQALLEGGADANDSEANGMTCLLLAVLKGNPEISSLLITYGASTRILTNRYKAQSKRIRQKLKSISSGYEDKTIDLSDVSPLWVAVTFSRLNIVESLPLGEIENAELELCLYYAERFSPIERHLLYEIGSRFNKRDDKALNITYVPVYNPKDEKKRIMLAYSKDIFKPSVEQFCGVEFRIVNPEIVSNEETIVMISEKYRENKLTEKERCLLETSIKSESERLFSEHSNLNIISMCHIKSKKGGSLLLLKPCVVFYCLTKHFIPLTDREFPTVLTIDGNEIPTDVREGYFQLGGGGIEPRQYNMPLRIGGSIGKKGTISGGTLGPFAELESGELGFITCKHVFDPIENGTTTVVIQPAGLSFHGSAFEEKDKECGVVKKHELDTKRNVSVDAALVKITNRVPDAGRFAINSIDQLGTVGFSVEHFPVYNTGSIKPGFSDADLQKCVIKFGSNTGLTKGVMKSRTTSVKTESLYNFAMFQDEKPAVTMKNQYEIESIGLHDFFQPGDSGAGVFYIESDKSLHCIGIAIGCTSHRTAIVTPIIDVLSVLELPMHLKEFGVDPMETDGDM